MTKNEEILTEKWNQKYLHHKTGNDFDGLPGEWKAHNLDFVSEAMDEFAINFLKWSSDNLWERLLFPVREGQIYDQWYSKIHNKYVSISELLTIFKEQSKTP